MPADKAISSRSAACVAGVARTLVIALAVALAACGGGLVPVHNVQNSPVLAARGQAPSAQQVRDAIMQALVSRGWQVDREGPDGVVATTLTRGNSATVLIRYDSRAYSISYLDSSPGLKFNGSYIHRRYNEWVEKLDKSIRKFLADVDYYPVQVVVPLEPAPPGAVDAPPPGPASLEAPPAPPPASDVPPPPAAVGAPDVAPHAAVPAPRAPKASQSLPAARAVQPAPPRTAAGAPHSVPPQPSSPPGAQQLEAPPAPPAAAPAARK